MKTTEQPAFWADRAAAQAAQQKKQFVVSCGITPSGEIHIGNMREVLTADAVHRALLESGQTSKLNYIADTFDPLRRVYPFLDAKIYEPLVGQPLSEIRCPCEKHENYAEHFLQPFLQSLADLGIQLEVIRADKAYKEGLYQNNIFRALEENEKIRNILKKETGKETPADWTALNVICSACKKLTDTKVNGGSREQGTISYVCACGHSGHASAKGAVKLTWRVDWPARWQALGVTVEPFGKDHASRGGSYDTGKRIAREVFQYDPPYPIPYEWISLKGFGDMSSSKGNVVSIAQMLRVSPPEVLRYSVLKVKPEKALTFDPGLPLLNLIDEVDDQSNKNRHARAIEMALVGDFKPLGVPFKHLITILQIAGDDLAVINDKLNQTGYPVADQKTLAARVKLARRWLDEFAPEDVKFSLQDTLPEVAASLSSAQKSMLAELASKLAPAMNGEAIHLLIYQLKEKFELLPQQLFEAVYLTLLGKKRGPRAGMFLASLDHKWLVDRLKEASR